MNSTPEIQNSYTPENLTYITGLEVFDDAWILDIDASIDAIQTAMFMRNPEKYGNFLETLEKQWVLLKIMRVPQREERLELFRYMYYAMRLLDDICDDDLVEKLHPDIVTNISSQAAWIDRDTPEYWLYDILIEKVLEYADKIGNRKEMKQSINQIAKSLQFDYERSVDNDPLRTEKELEENFDMMDILGTEYGTAVILWLDPEEAIESLTELGIACRIGYNIKDFIDDIYKNLINIPLEEIEEFWITEVELEQVKQKWVSGKIYSFEDLKQMELPASIVAWLEKEVNRMQILLLEFKNKYSVWGILFWNHAIPASYKQNTLRKRFNNLIIRLLVIPKVYISDIETSIGKK